MQTLDKSMRSGSMLYASRFGVKEILVVLVFLVNFLFASFSLVCLKPDLGFEIFLGLGFFLLCFLNMEVGLALFFLCILFSPEIVIEEGFVGSNRPIVTRFEDFLTIACGLGWLARIAVLREYKLFRSTSLNKPITLFVLLCVFSTLRGVSRGIVVPETGFFFVLKYCQYFLIFSLVSNYVRTYAQIQRLLSVAVIVLMCFCAYALWQVPSVQIWTTHRIMAPFAHQSESTSIGGILAFAMTIFLAMMIHAKKGSHKFWLGVGLVAIFIPFLYTLSRTSYIAFGFMLLMIVLYSRNKTLIWLMVIFLFLSPIVLPQQVLDRITYTWRDAREYGVDPSSQERLLVWKKMLTGPLMESPLTALFGFGVSAVDIMDNQYVRIVFETGLVGLFAFLWILVKIYQMARRVYVRTRISWVKGFGLGYIAGFLGLIVHGLGAITFAMIRTMEVFWFLTGIIFVYASIMDKVEPEILQKDPHLALPVSRR